MSTPPDTSPPAPGVVLARLRMLLLVVIVVGMAGTAADLLLLEHYEDGWQMAPLVMLALGLMMAAWAWSAASRAAVMALRVTMLVFLATGAAGLVLHFNGNMEFQHEMDPTLRGWDLFVTVMRAKAPPALAPAAIVQIGLLGLLFTYRHDALERERAPRASRRSS